METMHGTNVALPNQLLRIFLLRRPSKATGSGDPETIGTETIRPETGTEAEAGQNRMEPPNTGRHEHELCEAHI